MENKEKIEMRIDFKWIFTADALPYEDDKRFKDFLKEMYESSTSSFLLLRKEEEEYLRKL